MKLFIVAAIVIGCVVARRMYRQRQSMLQADQTSSPRLPSEIVAGSDRTWVVFTTKYCAQCGPIEQLLRSTQPDDRVVTIDAAREPLLAKAQRIKSAPTVLVANERGRVERRLVGAEAVRGFVLEL